MRRRVSHRTGSGRPARMLRKSRMIRIKEDVALMPIENHTGNEQYGGALLGEPSIAKCPAGLEVR